MNMNDLKLFLLSIANVLVMGAFSQTVNRTNVSSLNACDANATLFAANVDPATIMWYGMGVSPQLTPQNGGFYRANLCAGSYSITYRTYDDEPMAVNFYITDPFGIYPCAGYGLQMIGFPILVSECTGHLTVTTLPGNSIPPYTYLWSNGATTNEIMNLCPGKYQVTEFDNSGCAFSFATTVYQLDTITIAGGSCPDPIDTLYGLIDDCSIDFGAIDTAYLSSVLLPSAPGDTTITALWTVVDTTGFITNTTSYFSSSFNLTGCYYFDFWIVCYNKTMNTHRLHIKQGFYVDQYSVIDELINSEKTIVRITDITGRECAFEAGELRIVLYSDGSISKVISQ